VTVYCSAIYGGYDDPKPAPPGEAFMFTDDPNLVAPGWRVVVKDPFPHLHPRLKAKAPKCLPHVFLPEHPATVWVDGSMTVHEEANDIEPAALRFFRHPKRDNVAAEAAVSACMGKYQGLPVVLQANAYLAGGIRPELWASGFHLRDIREPGVVGFFERWWHENVLWTYQDQLSLPWARQLCLVDIVDLGYGLYTNPWFTIAEHRRGD